MHAARYAPPGDALALRAFDPAVLDLADSLWERAADEPRRDEAGARALTFEVSGFAASPSAGRDPRSDARSVDAPETWSGALPRLRVSVAGHLDCAIDVAHATVEARATPEFLEADPSRARRLLLEAPAAVLLAARGWRALHAAAVRGPHGVLVIRGANGAGKSTLAAACWRHGLEVLGDESVLAEHPSGTRIAASVRELHVRPDVVDLLEIGGEGHEVFVGGEVKIALPLGPLSAKKRCGPHLATVLLGERGAAATARVRPLAGAEFETRFAAGAIEQEAWHPGVGRIARTWGGRRGYLLEGHGDLEGAVLAIAHWLEAGRPSS